nr:hypothetical protein [Aliiroseovarius sediminilitoris]
MALLFLAAGGLFAGLLRARRVGTQDKAQPVSGAQVGGEFLGLDGVEEGCLGRRARRQHQKSPGPIRAPPSFGSNSAPRAATCGSRFVMAGRYVSTLPAST